jgi:hypothetical protein
LIKSREDGVNRKLVRGTTAMPDSTVNRVFCHTYHSLMVSQRQPTGNSGNALKVNIGR